MPTTAWKSAQFASEWTHISGPNDAIEFEDSRAFRVFDDGREIRFGFSSFSTTIVKRAYGNEWNFGFSPPTGGSIEITGIQVRIAVQNIFENNLGKFASVRLMDGSGTAIGSNKATASFFPTTNTYFTFGGSSDLWSQSTLDASTLDGLTAGVIFEVSLAEPDEDLVFIDHMQMRVTYIEIGPPDAPIINIFG